ncbi:OmpA family protein [Marinirhabdus gelatinilytica]|uniref:WD40 repeat protein n=1 Tax=Marinirhabdus gelatinilytica TaxID=1703343 RepID=A0A370Q962_9FLAO|nr:OmpA family protein [Marinirhabdus gelatinilytica]RDK84887.1 WD40 repeat protein [Marinirhabdus gelatinilytica]
MRTVTTSHKLILAILVLMVTSIGFSQKNKVEKANKEFNKFAYIDARQIYLQVVEDGYESAQIFKNLGDTYYWNSDYDNAAKWYQKLIANYPSEVEAVYYYRAAQSLKSLKKYDESDKLMDLYAAVGGDGLVVQNYKDDPDYLESIAFEAKGYELEKVSVNTKFSDFGPSYYGDKLVYASATTKSEGAKNFEWTDQPFLDLFVADMDSLGYLSNARGLDGDINTKYHESSTTFSKDGTTVYFTRNNFIDGKKGKDKNKTIRLKLYKATNNGDNNWANIEELPFNSKEYSVAHPTLSRDQKRLYFSSDMPGTLGMSDLWYVEIQGDNSYGEPVNLGPGINTEARESFPFISDEGNLYFSSDGRAGLGGYDIYVTTLDANGMPTKIKNLGEPANSNQDDFGFIIREEKRIGYLSSNRDGERGSIDDDIYRVQEICQIVLEGTVFDSETEELLPGATVQLLDENNALIEEVIADENAAFEFNVSCEKDYIIRGSKEEYQPYETRVTTPDESATMTVPIPLLRIGCPPNDLGCILDLQPIYFDFDRYNIRPDAAIELAKIRAAMIKYPELIIHIESHTDSRAPFKYNERLSEKRAQSTLNWLVDNGIERSRLTAKGYGERRLVTDCPDGVECTEEEHQLNRRSMFIIQN